MKRLDADYTKLNDEHTKLYESKNNETKNNENDKNGGYGDNNEILK
jgi:hypothetical protein